MDRYICVHAHFYQPPRENPWLETIELQDSAYPYHDWNERIAVECYAPNAASRILDGQQRIVQIVNNYSRISFNFGPTLLAWLKDKTPEIYRAILEADRESARRFTGHGSALAQAYNHVILPLANRRDKETQVRWGIRDFELHFGRRPEGMWLPETAVDIETLEVLAEHGIVFTILAPHQASRIGSLAGADWATAGDGRTDPSRAYLARLPSGRSISLFFYDGPISRSVAFERLLSKGEDFAQRLLNAFNGERDWPQLVHIATDGETYGHHHRFGDMALAWALNHIESGKLARLTNYGEYLERHPPARAVEIRENTSWSCVHGVERWRADCGCNTGARPGWNQAWRGPLREALDYLRDSLAEPFADKASRLLKDPWAARDDYIEVIADRSPESVERFFERQALRPLEPEEKTRALKLLEMQRHALLMYTSCAWFFDDLTNIETLQIIQYAARALQLAGEVLGDGAAEGFLERLESAKSNTPGQPNGRTLYEQQVGPAMVDLEKIAAHYAVSSLFEDYPEKTRVYCYTVHRQQSETHEARIARLVLGRAKFVSLVTLESAEVGYGALHLGDHNITAGLSRLSNGPFQAMVRDLTAPFLLGSFTEVIRIFDRGFGPATYSLKSLFRDEQRKILDVILHSTLEQAEASYRQIYENYGPLMLFLEDLRIPLPKALATAAEFVVNSSLRRMLEAAELDLDRVGELLSEAVLRRIALDQATLAFAMRGSIERTAERLAAQPEELGRLEQLLSAVRLARFMPFEVELWKVQNIFYSLLHSTHRALSDRADRGEAEAQRWVEVFLALGSELSVKVPDGTGR
jgi:alpha-amylase/alpha-mannosidase (GH57 family)